MSQASPNKQQSHQSGFTVAKQTALYQQHLDKVFCDVIIRIKDEDFYVHSCIVAATCPKLQKLIDELKNPTNPVSLTGPVFEVELEENIFPPKVFEYILSYIYLGVLDWSKVAPGLVNQILDAANWCEFNQLIEDYMSMSQEEEMENSTIVMVDTGIELDDSDEKDDDSSPQIFTEEVDHEGMFCVVCNERFELDDEEALAEHMKSHDIQSEGDLLISRRGVSKRKASLSVKDVYKSLIPNVKSSSDVLEKKGTTKKSRKKGKVTMFTQQILCNICNEILPSRKALQDHKQNDCPGIEEPEVLLEPLSTEEIANHLLAELISGNEGNSNVLPSTKGVTVQTGTIIRSYKTKRKTASSEPFMEKKFKTAKLWICPRCPDVVFEKKRDQLHHIRTVHGVIKRHMCEHCGKSLDGKTALSLHMRIHTGERPFTCPTCGRGFSERKTMEDHTRRHTGERPFLCTVCGKDFGYRQSLYRHMKFHIGERPYQCQVCSKTFVLKQNLHEHAARHTKHQLINCAHCDMRFSNKDLLLKHQLENHVTKNKLPMYETAEATQNISVKAGHLHVEEVTNVHAEEDAHNINVGVAQNISVLDLTEDGSEQVASYEVTIDNSVLESLAEQQ